MSIDGPIATVTLAVDPAGGIDEGYELKLNSYDLGVDIELYDISQRLRFEHPEVKAVVLTSALDRVFCAGANIQMLAGASHGHKVNFCKFTNETRNGIEDSAATSQLPWLCAINGTAAGGGYELALACAEIILVDDRSSTVSLPEVPLLGVLPGTGGLTRLVDKRKVRRDRADVFATRAEGVRAQQALDWGLVDSIAPPSGWQDHVAARAREWADRSDRPNGAGISLLPLERHTHLDVTIDRAHRTATLLLKGPPEKGPTSAAEIEAAGSDFWALALCRQLDDAILQLRFNEPELGTWVLTTEGDAAAVLAVDELLAEQVAAGHWLSREIVAFWKRTLKRLDVSARSLIALVEPGSCFAGTLAELALAADRTLMRDEDTTVTIADANDGRYPMGNGLSRLATRFWGHDELLEATRAVLGKALTAGEAVDLGLITAALDDIDWEDEVRLTLEERAAFSPDALTGLEASLRFAGPETTETKIFARLSAWQNWIFLRPNASGPDGALRRYGTGSRPAYDRGRV